ncbi:MULTISPECIES: aspartate/glutamate racemase family protein [Pseudomonadati]|uniref:Aspartate/glutamate racemase family protein n=1 Tax=Shewanella aestuarii TaxID=1028752 RepID=A0ABT0L3Z2_9GAMM|nr:aspartate/glutamate racemase family protein [Shewanella aestuarii]MCL1118442.1 aspartate/glutamate racemase family protein [Shewanella aestuarii]GGN82531.1 aspartate racemase [Shewanella aestuarii]
MKTIGLIGGMSWESTVSYYQAINQGVKLELGGLHSAKVCLYSVDFDEIEKLQRQNRWHDSAILLAKAAQAVEAGGADFVLICTNTMHKVADEVQAAISIPLVHIADATAQKLITDGIKRVGLLGTKFTMQEDFYKNRLTERFGIEVLVPTSTAQDMIHDVIYNQLCLGVINHQSRQDFISVINHLYQQGAEAVILGCTEIALLVEPQHTDVPLYDTTQIHAAKAVALAIKG